MISYDMVWDESDGDLKLTDSGADISIEQSDFNHIEDILQAEKGHFYDTPLIGYGVNKRKFAPSNLQREKNIIKSELKKDNYRVNSISIYLMVDGTPIIETDAEREK